MKNLSYEQLIDFSIRTYLKNRTTVTRYLSSIFKDFEQTLDLPLKYNKYPSGSEYGTWIIPPSWNVKEAWLKNSAGVVFCLGVIKGKDKSITIDALVDEYILSPEGMEVDNILNNYYAMLHRLVRVG
jgi:hypothetical protein